MDFDTYQQNAARTSGAKGVLFTDRVDWKTYLENDNLPVEKDTIRAARAEKRLMAAAMGLAGEAGELTDYLKKVTAHGHPLEKQHVLKEAGDVLWYVAEVLSCFGLSMNVCAEANIEKLHKRYGEAFSSEKSINRKE